MLEDSAALHALARWGYPAILLGTLLEGETVVLVAGFLAHQGYLSLPFIMLCALIGSCVSDQGLFFLARFKGPGFLARFPKLAAKADALAGKMRGKDAWLSLYALTFRFFYGLRNISPVVLGISAIPTLRFVLLNALGAAIWAACFSLLGFAFARTLESFMGNLARIEVFVVVLLLAAGLAFSLWRHWRRAARSS